MPINFEEVLSRTDRGLDIFKYYLGTMFFRPGKQFKSPFYQDSKASCNVYLDTKSNRYKYKDFGENENPVDCIGFVCRYLKKDASNSDDFISALNLIDRDLNLYLSNKEYSNNNKTIVKEKPIEQTINQVNDKDLSWKDKIEFQNFSSVELQYWSQYGIRHQLLQKYNIKSVKSFHGTSKNKKSYTIRSIDNQPIFAYCFEDYTKLYRPSSNLRFLFLGKKVDTYIFGYKQLPLRGDLLFITGGEKDVLSLSARGLFAISFNSETAIIPNTILKELSNRFNHIVVIYDCDSTGIKSMNTIIEAHKSHKLIKLILPLSGNKTDKDISDFFKKGKSKFELMQLFTNELSSMYANTINTLRLCEVNLKHPPKIQDPTISINGASVGSPGNLIGITGTEGSGKSNFISGAISGCLNLNNLDIDTLGMSVKENAKSKAVIIYDTEQSEVQLYKNIQTLKSRAKLLELPKWFKAFSLVGLNRKERLTTIIESIDKFHYEFNGIHLIIIDGIADLIGSVNDEEQSVELISKLFQIAGYYNTIIVCVLHLNPGGLKLRGHLGSELQRKASGVLSVEKRKDQPNSIVKVLKLREANPMDTPIIQFAWDVEKGHHAFIGYLDVDNTKKSRLDYLSDFAITLFEDKQTIQSAELSEYLKNHFEIKDRMARNYIKIMRDNLIIKKENTEQNAYILNIEPKKS